MEHLLAASLHAPWEQWRRSYDANVNTRTVDTHMSRIRKKLEIAEKMAGVYRLFTSGVTGWNSSIQNSGRSE